MASRTKKRTRTLADKIMTLAINPSTAKLDFETQRLTETPSTITQAVTKARDYAKRSSFLQMFLPKKKAVLDYRCVFQPAGTKGAPPTPEEKLKLATWLAEMTNIQPEPVADPQNPQKTIGVELLKTNREMLTDFLSEALDEINLLDTAVAFWIDDQDYAFTLPMEKCEYQDVLGVPILRYTHGLGTEQVKLLPPDQQELFKSGTVTINPDDGQHFKVFKRNRSGDGFGWPGIFSIFKLLGEIESKEFGFNAMAFLMRNARRCHKLGYGILTGDRAGRPHAFNFTAKRATAITRDFDQVVGASDYICSFDHEITFPWPDLKMFDEIAWQGSNARLIQWAGPLGQMLIAKNVMPYLSPILKAQVLAEREKFRLFVEPVINAAFKPPVPIKLSWSNLIFNDARLQSEILKFAAIQGWASVATQQEEAGFNPDQENERKLAEVANPDAAKIFLPMWDSSHGISPALGESLDAGGPSDSASGADPGSKNGKPTGTQDKT